MADVIIGRDRQTGAVVTLGDRPRRSGSYVFGKPGMGKSTLIANIAGADIAHGHGVFLLDAHGDTIDDLLTRFDFPPERAPILLDPEDEACSFGINLFACRDVTSMNARKDTYARVQKIFHQLWTDDWGPWLQLMFESTVPVFIENPQYTLTEVPRFLTDPHFRAHLVSNMRYELYIADYWRHEFAVKRQRDQIEMVQSLLTRVRTLLNLPHVRDIVSQGQTTIDFAEILDSRRVLLVKLSANLPKDIKKFIGTILLSELVHAVRNRPEDKRHQFDTVAGFLSHGEPLRVCQSHQFLVSLINYCF